nr:hypothetical protein [Tanacetum cinerariifolium]
MHQEKVHQEKLKAVKARLNFEEVSQHSESRTPSKRRDLRERLRSKYVRNVSEAPNQGATDLNHQGREVQNERVVEILKAVTKVPAREEQNLLLRKIITKENPHVGRKCCQKGKAVQEDTGSQDQKCKSQVLRTMICPNPSHIKTYDGSEDPEDHLIILQAAVKTERWAMPTWCHMFISTLTGNARVWFDDLPQKFIDSYDDLKKAFPENYLQQKNASKIRLKFTTSSIEMGNPRKSLCGDEMMRVTTSFLKGKVAASSRERKKSFSSWKQQEAGQKQNFKKGGSRNQHRSEQKQGMFTLLTKTPKEILALDKGKFKPPPPMTTPREKRNTSIFYEFHVEVGHVTDETKVKQWEIPCKEGRKLSKGQAAGNPDGTAMANGSQTKDHPNLLSRDSDLITTPRGGGWTEGPMIIEAEMRRHFVHRMYVDEGSSSEILYDHCFNRFRPKAIIQMIPAATPLVRFSGEIIWPLAQISLLVKICNEEHSTFEWMNFMVVRSPSPYNRIIRSPRVKRIQAVPSTTHEMLKFPVTGGMLVIDKVTEEKIQIAIHPEYPKQTIAIGSTLTEEGRKELCEHGLNIREGCLPVRQKKIGQAPERNKAIYEEVKKMVNTSIMKEVHYHIWLSNPVMVKKHDNSWKMCVDFKDLNKACPKNGYPLSKIDWKVEYEALIADLRIAEQMGVKNLQANIDSRLVANQVNETYIAKEPGMIKYLEKVKNLTSTFKEFSIKQVPRGENKKANALSKMASISFAHLSKQYLMEEILPEEKRKARAIRRKARKLCLREIHEGSCSMHAGPRSVVAKAQRSGNEETPFSLTYETKAVIPVEIGMPTLRIAKVDMIKNNEALEINLDLLEERREQAVIHETKNKAKMEKYYNVRVRNTSLKPGDLIYQNNEASNEKDEGKLGPKWEGPFAVTEALEKGAYKLRNRNGNVLP